MSKWKIGLPIYVAILTIAAAVIAMAWLVFPMPFETLSRDSLAVAERAIFSDEECCAYYFGAISNIGILGWMTTSAICIFAAAIGDRVFGMHLSLYFLAVACFA